MNNEFEDVMSKRTDSELLQVINSSPGDYQPLALEAAKIEFKKRNLSNEQIKLAKDEIKQKQDLEYAKNNEPLSTIDKIFAFIFPLRIISTILWKGYLADGQERKYKERIRWQLYGLGFYTLYFLFLFLKYVILNK